MNEDTAWLRRIVRWAVNVVVVLALAWFLVYAFCAQVPVSGNSMQPVLSADDVVLVNRLVYDVGEPERLDIVVFEREDHKKNVKRIIGLPGETVQIKGGFIFINGEVLSVEDGLEQVSLAGRADTPIQLEQDEYFLLGDNRDSSEDSLKAQKLSKRRNEGTRMKDKHILNSELTMSLRQRFAPNR